jgi:hypothetical protein
MAGTEQQKRLASGNATRRRIASAIAAIGSIAL